jgi:hypothetical protein
MENKETRKELINAYKERSRTSTGGVYIIRNTQNGKLLLETASDIEAASNRFGFAQTTGSCINYKLQKDWSAYGSKVFVFEVAETLKKNDDQTPAQFREDLDFLKKLWTEKFDPATLY